MLAINNELYFNLKLNYFFDNSQKLTLSQLLEKVKSDNAKISELQLVRQHLPCLLKKVKTGYSAAILTKIRNVVSAKFQQAEEKSERRNSFSKNLINMIRLKSYEVVLAMTPAKDPDCYFNQFDFKASIVEFLDQINDSVINKKTYKDLKYFLIKKVQKEIHFQDEYCRIFLINILNNIPLEELECDPSAFEEKAIQGKINNLRIKNFLRCLPSTIWEGLTDEFTELPKLAQKTQDERLGELLRLNFVLESLKSKNYQYESLKVVVKDGGFYMISTIESANPVITSFQHWFALTQRFTSLVINSR